MQFIILLFLSSYCFGQSKTIDIPVSVRSNLKGDTSLWFKDYFKLTHDLKLENLQLSTDSFHFRFWTDTQAIDIWTSNNKKFSGSVTSFAQRYNEKLLKKEQYEVDKVFSNTSDLDSITSRYIYQSFESLQIQQIPTDGKIKGWSEGLDGFEYLIEVSTKTTYSFKTYWSPIIFVTTLVEAKKIQAFHDYLFRDMKLGDYYNKLQLPIGSFKRNGVPGITIKTEKQINIGAKTIFDLL